VAADTGKKLVERAMRRKSIPKAIPKAKPKAKNKIKKHRVQAHRSVRIER